MDFKSGDQLTHVFPDVGLSTLSMSNWRGKATIVVIP
jgi:hypothetical protein